MAKTAKAEGAPNIGFRVSGLRFPRLTCGEIVAKRSPATKIGPMVVEKSSGPKPQPDSILLQGRRCQRMDKAVPPNA